MAEKVEYILSIKDAMSSALGKMQGGINSLEKGIGRANMAGSTLGSTLTKAFALVGGIALGKDIIDTTAKFETLNNVIKFTSVNQEDATKNFEFLKDVTQRLKVPIVETTEAFSQLSATLMGSKLQGQGARDIFEGISTGITAMHLSSEQAQSVFLALTQMMSKGKVQAQELTLQLGQALPGAQRIAAAAMHMTTAELQKQMQAGTLLAEDFVPKFAAEIKKEFGAAIPNAVKSLQANLTDLSNEWLLLKRDVGEVFLPIMLKTVHFLKDEVIPALRSVGHFVEDHKALFIALGSALTVGYTAMKLMAAGTWIFNAALAALELNPIILALTALAAALGYAIEKYREGKQEIEDNRNKAAGDAIKEETNYINEQTESLSKWLKISKEAAMQKAVLQEIANVTGSLENANDPMSKGILNARLGYLQGLMNSGKEGNGAGGAMTKGTGAGLKSDITKVEGQKPQNFYLNITNLIEGGINITTQQLKEGTAQAKEMVLKALIEAANDVAIVARQS